MKGFMEQVRRGPFRGGRIARALVVVLTGVACAGPQTPAPELSPGPDASTSTATASAKALKGDATKANVPGKRGINPGALDLVKNGVAMASSNPEGALRLFQQAADWEPTLAAAYFNSGIVHERVGRYGDAQSAYEEAISVDPSYEPAYQNLANLAVRKKDFEGAERLLREGLKKHGQSLALRNRLAAVYLAANRLNEAEVEAKAVLKTDERNIDGLVNIASVFFRRGQTELATAVLDRAREIDPNQAQVWNRLGFVYLKEDKPSEATEAFKRATELRGDLPEAHNNLGALYIETHNYDAAIQELKVALQLYPDFGDAYVNLGNAYKGNQQYQEAEQSYLKAQNMMPEALTILYNLGVLHLDNLVPGTDPLTRWDKAKSYLASYLDTAELSKERRQRVESFISEAERGKKREHNRIESDKRRAEREARKVSAPKEQPTDSKATESTDDASKEGS
jgi:tetratricopeptide (TPR) repeat protein